MVLFQKSYKKKKRAEGIKKCVKGLKDCISLKSMYLNKKRKKQGHLDSVAISYDLNILNYSIFFSQINDDQRL